MRAVGRYLARHAEPEAELARVVQRPHGHVLAIPAFAEAPDDFRALDGLTPQPEGPVLAIVVVNAPPEAAAELEAANRALLSELRERHRLVERSGGLVQMGETAFGTLIVVERTGRTAPIPARQGVGLARKIAADLALAVAADGLLLSRLIHFTDADARLPTDYFERAPAGDDPAAAVYPFEHELPRDAVGDAMVDYEAGLRHYVLSLCAAGSPYAYHSIGSILAVGVQAYAAVRGVPRRNGAEDFYLLNKLAKTGPVERLTGRPVTIATRVSDRVPFGTGPALKQRLKAPSEGVYAPEGFRCLGALLAAFPALLRQEERALEHGADSAGGEPSLLQDAFDAAGLGALVAGARARSKQPSTRLRHLHTAFDAFQTRKLIHLLRDGPLPPVPLRVALASHAASTEGTPRDWLLQLRQLEATRGAGRAGLWSG